MKIKEIKASISGVIPIASYENLKPYYEISADLSEGEDVDACIKQLDATLRWHFDQASNRAKADVIEKQYAGVRFYEKNGKKYPSVTSILGWNVDWKISEDELQQYGSRGNIIHKIIELYFQTKKWGRRASWSLADAGLCDQNPPPLQSNRGLRGTPTSA